jgi:hypothetical protein
MLQNLITDIDNFDNSQIDHDCINNSTTYFSIYNNKINIPFHKFWFLISNVKFYNAYDDNRIFRFALNNKSENIKKFIIFFNKLSEQIKIIFDKYFNNITVISPWKEYDNYPCLLTIFNNQNVVMVDKNKNLLNIDNLNYSDSYSILFEINKIKVINTNTTYQLKYDLVIMMIQKELDINLCLLNEFTQNSNVVIKNKELENSKPILPFLKQLNNIELNPVSKNTGNNICKSNIINLDEILTIKAKLNKVKLDTNKTEDIINSELNSSFLIQKNKLKKVKTKEKNLFKRIKKDCKKKIIKENLDIEIDLEKEFELL